MPLSDHEQRLLEQMEQALQAEDPKFATTMRGSDLRRRYVRRAVLSVIAFIAGIVMLMSGAVTQVIPLGVAGFVVMLGSAWLGVTSWKRTPEATAEPDDIPDISPGSARRVRRASGRKQPGGHGSFMQRLEERWRQRRERGYGN
ncbi:DUF3040 domain-containing protein [Phytoactinopolyspora limicola]|uniref:DUF3040 domain-containing protein n=1 Tax=Phytoactinopolyspora limicola TaxID=2715536 RepID=UPI00140AD2D9|nr:DUF3040 domain-containing protein [Phytoactinopolyspora limicola]